MIDTGGSAFPSKKRVYRAGYPTDDFVPIEGMTLRDYFAGEAMQAMIIKGMEDNKRGATGVPFVVDYAYNYADAMIKQRKQGV